MVADVKRRNLTGAAILLSPPAMRGMWPHLARPGSRHGSSQLCNDTTTTPSRGPLRRASQPQDENSCSAAAIVAAGHSLSAEPLPSVGYGRAQWEWHSGAAIAPRWSVSVGSFSYRSDRGSSTRETAREALLGALAWSPMTARFCSAGSAWSLSTTLTVLGPAAPSCAARGLV